MARRKGSGARRRTSILSDPRYQDYVRRYRHDWQRFFVEGLDFPPTNQQREVIAATNKEGARVSVTSGHGTGKSDSTAGMIIAFVTTYYDARVVLTANNANQVKIGVWKYLRKHWNAICRSYPWLEQYFTMTDTMFYANESKQAWSVGAKSCRLGQEESLAGEHAAHLLVVVDEASGVSDKAFGVMTGAFTQHDNRMLLLSQPTRPSGYFYDTHHKLAEKKEWVSIRLNSEESPIVDTKFIRTKLIEYGGREAPEYLIKVRGEFPSTIAGMLLGRADMDRAAKRSIQLPKGWGWMATCDVGNGRDKSIININKVWGEVPNRLVVNHKLLVMDSNITPVRFADVINAECSEDLYPNITIAVDSDGVGHDTATLLIEKHRRRVERINWGLPMFSDQLKKRFLNRRAYANVMARDAILQGRMATDNSSETAEQGSKVPCGLNERGAWVIMPKKVMREKLNIKSPDQWDTYCFTQLVGFVPADELLTDDMVEERSQIEDWIREADSEYDEYDDYQDDLGRGDWIADDVDFEELM
jgi:hypothetical protein